MNFTVVIELADLPEETREWIVAKARSTGRTLAEVITAELGHAAGEDGFPATRPPGPDDGDGPHQDWMNSNRSALS